MENHAKILLVEDEALNAYLMTVMLKSIGYRVQTTITTGEDAILFVARDTPDLILMDINLAGRINGIEALRQIKTRFDIPVIFVTGYSDAAIRLQAQELNPVAYLVKPILIAELEKILRSVLGDAKNPVKP